MGFYIEKFQFNKHFISSGSLFSPLCTWKTKEENVCASGIFRTAGAYNIFIPWMILTSLQMFKPSSLVESKQMYNGRDEQTFLLNSPSSSLATSISCNFSNCRTPIQISHLNILPILRLRQLQF